MRAIVPHSRRLMMVETAHKLSDFSWIYKGWKIFNKKHSEKIKQIDIAHHPLDETQFRKRKSIPEILISRIDMSCIMIQWVCTCMILMVKSQFFAMLLFLRVAMRKKVRQYSAFTPSVFALVHSNIRITMSLALIFGPSGVLRSIGPCTWAQKEGPSCAGQYSRSSPLGPKKRANIYNMVGLCAVC
jgi:hypothetical protein